MKGDSYVKIWGTEFQVEESKFKVSDDGTHLILSREKKISKWSTVNEGKSGEKEGRKGRSQIMWALQALMTSINFIYLQWEVIRGVLEGYLIIQFTL